MKLEKYVRTIGGEVGRNVKYENSKYYIEVGKNKIWEFSKKFIVKHSKQLIDLIESEDLIIYRLRGLKSQRRGFIRIYNDGKEKLGIDNYSLEQVKIIKILTHQQFEANCYKVGGEE